MKILHTTILTLASAAIVSAQAALVIMDEIIAVVDEDVITQSELRVRRAALESQFSDSQDDLPPRDVLDRQIVERLVIESLQLQMADRSGIRISDEELNEAMSQIAAQNDLTLEEFSRNIEKEGITYINMRDQVRREITINRIQQGIMQRRIQVTEQEINNFLASELGESVIADQFLLAHILVSVAGDAAPAQVQTARLHAETLINRSNAGEDFESLALEASAVGTLNFSNLGWRILAQLPTIFADVVADMNANEIRGPIKSDSGFHIIRLMQKRGASVESQIAQTKVRHILIKPSEILSKQECRSLLNTLREEIINGRAFEEIAKLHSDDPGSALNGGDLGWAREGLFVPAFEQQMLNAQQGELTEVFESSHGFHILEVTDRRVKDFSKEFKMGRAESFLRNQKFDEELQTWIREIREDAFVEIRL